MLNGIELIGCQEVTTSNPHIQRPYTSGIYIYDFSGGVHDWGQTDEMDIMGGHVNTPAVAGVEIDCSNDPGAGDGRGADLRKRFDVPVSNAGNAARAKGWRLGQPLSQAGTSSYIGEAPATDSPRPMR